MRVADPLSVFHDPVSMIQKTPSIERVTHLGTLPSDHTKQCFHIEVQTGPNDNRRARIQASSQLSQASRGTIAESEFLVSWTRMISLNVPEANVETPDSVLDIWSSAGANTSGLITPRMPCWSEMCWMLLRPFTLLGFSIWLRCDEKCDVRETHP